MKHTITISRRRYEGLLRAELVACRYREAVSSPVCDPQTAQKWRDVLAAALKWLKLAPKGKVMNCATFQQLQERRGERGVGGIAGDERPPQANAEGQGDTR